MSVIHQMPKKRIVTAEERIEYETMRMEFEKAAQERHVFGASLDYEVTHSEAAYKDDRVQACWLFWQAGVAIAPPVAAGSVDTEDLRRLALHATRGPWRHTRQGVIVAGPFRQYTNGSAQSQIASFCVTSHEEDDEHQTEKQVPNALFVAAACPDVVLALIERAEKAEARVKELETKMKDPTKEGKVYGPGIVGSGPGAKEGDRPCWTPDCGTF